MLILWWLKPLLDRLILQWFSQAIFSSEPGWRDLLKALPQLLRQTGLLRSLTIGRFSLARSFHLPVWQLEHQSGADVSHRTRLLDRRASGAAVYWLIACAHMEIFMALSLWLLAAAMLPNTAVRHLAAALLHGQQNLGLDYLENIFWMLAVALVEPLYMVCGFTLYLNRRSELEGWDIELAFRRLGQRAGVLIVALCLTAAMLLPGAVAPVMAADAVASTPRHAVEDVLADPAFGHKQTVSHWQLKPSIKAWLKDRLTPAGQQPAPTDPWWPEQLEQAAGWIRWTVWLLGAALLTICMLWLLRNVRVDGLRVHRKNALAPPRHDTVFGLHIEPASLPQDLASQARRLAAEGALREALSLLYRGSLSELVHQRALVIYPGDTERDCARRAGALLPAAANAFFNSLIGAWQSAAYGHHLPDQSVILALCDGWSRHFGTDGVP